MKNGHRVVEAVKAVVLDHNRALRELEECQRKLLHMGAL
jgi:hypothetical protein